MIERLRHALEHIEELSPEIQEDLAVQIEEMIDSAEQPAAQAAPPAGDLLPRRIEVALDAIGSWRNLQDDDPQMRIP